MAVMKVKVGLLSRTLALGCVLAVLSCFSMSHAQEAKALEAAAGEKFDDWQVECGERREGKSACQMYQAVSAEKDGPKVFLLSISAKSEASGSVAVISVPIGVYLANGIQIQVDHKRPFKVLYEVCDKNACHAGFQLSGAVLQAFKKGSNASFGVWTTKNKAVKFAVSLKGFSAAYKTLLDKENE